jgi:hypothetical protein
LRLLLVLAEARHERARARASLRRVQFQKIRALHDARHLQFLRLPSGLVLRGFALHFAAGRWRVAAPTLPFRDIFGDVPQWAQLVDFVDDARRQKFLRLALDAALRAYGRDKERARA